MVYELFSFRFVEFRFSRYVGVAHVYGAVGNLFQARAGTRRRLR